jgi:acetoin utilization protein AcuB
MTKADLVNALVSDVMTGTPITVDPYTSLAAANELMQVKKVRRLPVMKKGKLVGIITQSDILEARPSDIKQPMNIEAMNKYLKDIIVDLVMTKDPVTIYQNDTIGHAAEVMLDRKIGGLPVIDTNHNLVGVLTESDLFRLMARHWQKNA